MLLRITHLPRYLRVALVEGHQRRDEGFYQQQNSQRYIRYIWNVHDNYRYV